MKRYILILYVFRFNINNQWCCCTVSYSDDESIPSHEQNASSKRSSQVQEDAVDYKIAKLNREAAKELNINRKESKSILMQRFISDQVPMEWHLTIKENPDQCIIVSDSEIKKTKDAHPLIWYSWKIEGKKQGTAIIELRAIRNNVDAESETVTVRVN